MVIRKICNLKYNDHTLYYFTKAEILRLPELIKYMTLSYVKAGIVGPFHVQKLWTRLASTRGTPIGCYIMKQQVNNVFTTWPRWLKLNCGTRK